MGKNVLKTIATGDMFITRRIAKDGYEGFEEVRDCIMEHDVKFSNLEMTFHDQEGYPAAESGGTWAMMEPGALDDIQRFGFNLYNTANNHSGDYGQEGVMATIRHLNERDMVFSGTGKKSGRCLQGLLSGDQKGKGGADQRILHLQCGFQGRAASPTDDRTSGTESLTFLHQIPCGSGPL